MGVASSSTLSSPVPVPVSSYTSLNDDKNKSDVHMRSSSSGITTTTDSDLHLQQQQQHPYNYYSYMNTNSVPMKLKIPIPLQFQNDPMAIHIQRDLPHHTIEQKLRPESGRLGSTYRIKHVPSGSVMVLKVMVLSILQIEQQQQNATSHTNSSINTNINVGNVSSNSAARETDPGTNTNTAAKNCANQGSSNTDNANLQTASSSKRETAPGNTTSSSSNINAPATTATSVNTATVVPKELLEHGSITQHELQLQENELKRILLLVSAPTKTNTNTNTNTNASRNTNISAIAKKETDANLKQLKTETKPESDNNDDENENNITNASASASTIDGDENDFSHGILPYQAWYISPFNILTNSNTSSTNTITTNTTTTTIIKTKRPIYLLRPHVYTTLSIKIITRPFLSNSEKMYIAHQIIRCVQSLHGRNLCHGHLTCDNIGLSSYHSVFLLDILPVPVVEGIRRSSSNSTNDSVYVGGNRAVRPLLIPDDDPSDWIYYFQERNTTKSKTTAIGVSDNGGGNTIGGENDTAAGNGGGSNTTGGGGGGGSNASDSGNGSKSKSAMGGEKKCYIAPERFVSSSNTTSTSPSSSPSSLSAPPTKLTPAMDIFSLGCVLMELFLNGETAMDLGDLMEYRRIGGNISAHSTLSKKLNKIESGKMRAAVRNMLHLDPAKRLSAGEYLNRLMATTANNNTSATNTASGGNAGIGGGTSTSSAPLPSCHETVFFPLMKRMRCQILSPDARIALAAIHYEKVIYETVGAKDLVGAAYFRNIIGPTTIKLLEHSDMGRKKELEQHQQEEKNRESDKEDQEEKMEDQALLQYQTFSFASHREGLSNNNGTSSSTTQTPSSDALIIFVQFILSTIRYTQRPSSKLVGLQLLCRISQYSTDEVRLQRIVPTIVSILHDTDANVRAKSITVLSSILALIEHFPPSDAQVFPQYIFKKVSHLINDSALIVRVAFTESIAILAETALRFLDICHAIKLYETVEEGPMEEENSSPKHFRREEKTDYSSVNTTALIRNDYDKYLSELQETVARWVVSITTDTSNYASPLKQALLKDIARLCHFFGHDGVMACILPQVLAFLNHRRDWQLRAALCQHLPSICTMVGRAATEQFVVPCVETALIDDEEKVISSALRCLGSLVEMGLITRKILLGARSKAKEKTIPGIIKKYSTLLIHPSDDVRYAASFFVAACSRSIGFPDDEVFLLPIIRPYLRYDIQRNRLQTSEGISSCLISPSTKEQADLGGNNQNSLRILNDSIEGVQKAAFSMYCYNQKYVELLSKPLPVWYYELKQVSRMDSTLESEISSLRSMSALSQVYGVSIMQPTHSAQSQKLFRSNLMTTDASTEMLKRNVGNKEKFRDYLSDPSSRSFVAAATGEWGAEALLDPALAEISQNVSKLVSLNVPVSPPHLGRLHNRDGRFYSCHMPVMSSAQESKLDKIRGHEWRPKVDILTCSTPPNEHNGPVSRLSVSQDQSFFVSGSHDGTCKVWETHQILDSAGELCSSLTYDGHSNIDSSQSFRSRINDVSIVENSHSVVSGDSNGVVHVWRVDTFAKNSATADYNGLSTKTSGVTGCTMLRKVDPCEGEILAVSHFNTSAASIITFATHRGVHSWDLRCAYEPFYLNLRPEYGHVTSMAVGNDRNWIVAGSNRGYLALWDVRFQKLVKLWQHESGAPVNRLATSFAALPGSSERDPKPYIVMGCGLNETAVFDISRGSCSHCFRVLDPALCYTDQSSLPGDISSLPALREINMNSGTRYTTSGVSSVINRRVPPPEPSIQSFTGRIGANEDNYLATAGSDGSIHYWNFSSASKCFTVCSSTASRPIYEKVGLSGTPGTLFVCRQLPAPKLNEIPSANIPKALQKGTIRPNNCHKDSILDIKKLEYPMKGILSCSRDKSIKFWR